MYNSTLSGIILMEFFHRLTTKFKRLKSQRFEDWLSSSSGEKRGCRGVINLICWVLLIELVPTTGPVVVGTSSINRTQQIRFINPPFPFFSPHDEDRGSLRNVVILIF